MVTFMPDNRLRITAHGATSVGGRSSNQDAFAVYQIAEAKNGSDLFVVADGMGGHGGGGRASHLALSRLHEAVVTEGSSDFSGVEAEEMLRKAFLGVDQFLQETGNRDPRYSGMGTTLTAAWLRGDSMTFGHAGDSRLYVLRDGKLRQVTQDQNVAYRLWREGRLTDDEYRQSPYRCALLSYVGGGKIDVEAGSMMIRAGDRLVLATDGLVDEVVESELLEAVTSAVDPKFSAEKLVRLAEVRGARDNITALVVFVDPY